MTPRSYGTLADVSPSTLHKRRYRAANATGTWQPYVDPRPAMRRLQILREAGWSRDALCYATGVSVIGIEKLVKGDRVKIRHVTEQLILTVDLDPRRIPPHLFVPAIGTQRRIGALTYMAWSYKDMGERSGLGWTMFERAMNRRRVSAGIASAVADLYDQIWDSIGPTPRAATLARKYGRVGPLAWDDHQLDEPTAKPRGVVKAIPCPR